MTDTSKRVVEGFISGHQDLPASIKEVLRALVSERDSMSGALSFIASKGEDVGMDQVERIARQAMEKK